jgi:hypothetical protein
MRKLRVFQLCVFLFLLPGALCAVLGFSRAADAATLRIAGISKYGDAAQIKSAIAGWALALAPGDTLMVYDAHDRTLITSIAIPDDPRKSRPERKIENILGPMAALNKYLAALPAAKADDPNLINASPFLDALGPIIADHSSENIRVLLSGPAWFSAPGSLEKKDYIGAWPSDGLIVADRSRSPFGTQGKHDLSGTTIDYCYTGGESGFLTPEHHERVERAWSIIVAQRGGQLTTFSGDQKTCFDRFAEEKAPEARHFQIDPTDATMQYMYRPQDAAPRILSAPPIKTGEATPPPSSALISAEAARFDEPARTTPPSTKTGIAWLGVQWLDGIDLDLYVRCEATSPFLFFGHQRSVEGHHNGDWRVGTGREFESVDLTAPCADISKAEVFVNFYSGTAPASPKGVFAIEFDGGLYKTNFEIPARTGNGGQGLSPSASMGAPYWVKIDLPTVLKLNASAAAHPRNRSTR